MNLFLNEDGSFISKEIFYSQIESRKQYFRENKIKNIAINLERLSEFAASFFAASSLGIEIVMLPNYQVGTIKNFANYIDLVVDSTILFPISERLDLEELDLKKETSIVMFTSGSTGEPKKVEKKLEHLINEVKILNEQFKINEETVYFGTVVHWHIYGLLFRVLLPFLTGGRIANFTIEFEENFEKWKDHKGVLISSPAFLKRLVEKTEYLYFNNVFSSGGKLDSKFAKSTNKKFGIFPTEVFGSTETGGIAYRNQENENQLWTFFDGVSGQLDERGCLLINSSFIEDKNYQTDDLVIFHDESRFSLEGRADRVYKIEEKKVSLPEMEKRLLLEANVKDVRCIVLSDQTRTMIGCLISLNDDSELRNVRKIEQVKHFKTYLSDFFDPILLPKKFRFLDDLPYNEQSKLTHNILLEAFGHGDK